MLEPSGAREKAISDFRKVGERRKEITYGEIERARERKGIITGDVIKETENKSERERERKRQSEGEKRASKRKEREEEVIVKTFFVWPLLLWSQLGALSLVGWTPQHP